MFLLRLLAVLAVVAIVAGLVAFAATGNRRYLRLSGRLFAIVAAIILVLLLLLGLERLLVLPL